MWCKTALPLMSLQRAKDLITEAGKLITAEAMESGSEESDSFFQAISGLVISKQAVNRIINDRELVREACRDLFGPDHPANSGAVSGTGGVAGRTEGPVQVSGAPEALNTEPPQ